MGWPVIRRSQARCCVGLSTSVTRRSITAWLVALWTDEQFDALIDHPDPDVRVQLAEARHATPDQRARLVEDTSVKAVRALARGRLPFSLPFAVREPALPPRAYNRLTERDTQMREEDAEAWVSWA